MRRVNVRLAVVFCAGMLSGAALLTRADARGPIREPEQESVLWETARVCAAL